MYDVTLLEAVTITGKSKRTIQRYMGQGKLTFVTGEGDKKLLNRLELLEVVGIVTPSPNDVSPPLVTPELSTSNPLLEKLIELQGKQLAATLENTALLKQLLEGKTVMAIEELTPYEPKLTDVAPVSNYLDDIPCFVGGK